MHEASSSSKSSGAQLLCRRPLSFSRCLHMWTLAPKCLVGAWQDPHGAEPLSHQPQQPLSAPGALNKLPTPSAASLNPG